MNRFRAVMAGVFLYTAFVLSSCAVQEEMTHSAKQAPQTQANAPELKATPLKASGDVGLLDSEKNYLILVTKEGKLVTADFTEKSKVTRLIPEKAKMSDINLGQPATVMYTTRDGKKVAESVEYIVKAKK